MNESHPHDEDAAVRGALREVFDEWQTQAPAAPDRAVLERRASSLSAGSHPARPLLPRVFRLGAAMAVAAGLIAIVMLALRDDPVLGPRAALLRAAERYQGARDAELRVKFDIPGVRSLLKIFGSEGEPPEAKYFRLLVRAPREYVVAEIDGPNGEWNDTLQLDGFDGKRSWSYDRKKRHVVISDPPDSEEDRERREKTDLMDYLSLDYTTELADEEKYRVTELTGPADERVGRRVLRLEAVPEEVTKGFRPAWTESEIHIDARTGQMQKVIVEAEVLGASMLRFEIDLVATDVGLTDDQLRFGGYLGDDILVIDENR